MLKAFQMKGQTTASTSPHVYFMLSDSCTVFLHLYKSAFFFFFLPSASSEQCSLWLFGSIKVCQMNRKSPAWRGNEMLSKATWKLKHFFISIFSFGAGAEQNANSLSGCLTRLLIGWEMLTVNKGENPQSVNRVKKVFVFFFFFLRPNGARCCFYLGEGVRAVNVHE